MDVGREDVGNSKSVTIIMEKYSEIGDVEIRFQIDSVSEGYLNDAIIRLYRGWNQTDGDVYIEHSGVINAGGYAWGRQFFSVPAGCYTAEIASDGYHAGYINIIVVPAVERYYRVTLSGE